MGRVIILSVALLLAVSVGAFSGERPAAAQTQQTLHSERLVDACYGPYWPDPYAFYLTPAPYGLPWFGGLYCAGFIYAGRVVAPRPPYKGAAMGAIVAGASGTERNLARHALQQVVQLLPGYLAAYGVDPALGPVIAQQIAAYANAYTARPPSPQQLMQQIPAMIAAYAASGRGTFFTPPSTGEAGLVELYADVPDLVLRYYDELVPAELVDEEGAD